MKIELDPMLGKKIDYIWAAHKKPWSLYPTGEVGHVNIQEGVIRVGFTVSMREAKKTLNWDEENNRVFVEVRDAEGRVVMDNWIKFEDKRVLVGHLCLGE